VLIFASSLGLNDTSMKPVFARLWDEDAVGLRFLFTGGRGKAFRGLYPLAMLEELEAAAPQPEPDPSGFRYLPYGGLALHRRADWLVAVKGHSKYVWDYEAGKERENVYGQYVSLGMLTIFSRGRPVSDVASGYRLDQGWDWYRMPGVTAVHFPVRPQKPLEHRRFSSETFLGAVTCDGENGTWGMVLNQPTFADGTAVRLRARKSAFFVDELIVLLGTGIRGGDGAHSVETTLFQTFVDDAHSSRLVPSTTLVDPAGNGYYVPNTSRLRVFSGEQRSYRHDGRTPSRGRYAVAWLDHGLRPRNAAYRVAILVRGAGSVRRLAAAPDSFYRVREQSDALHHVEFPARRTSGLVFFEPATVDHAVVTRVTRPCLVMCRQLGGRRVRVGVTNPDLGLLAPDAPPPTFKFIAKNENQYRPSQPRSVDVVLRGRWRMSAAAEGVTVVASAKPETTLRVTTRHGKAVQVELIED